MAPSQIALIDTGADGTLVPMASLKSIHADEQYVARLRSHWGEWYFASIYLVDLEIEGQIFPAVEVVADESGTAILLGRYILNRLILLLDGLHQQTNVLARRPIKL
jgi:predicted aspartyl protease